MQDRVGASGGRVPFVRLTVSEAEQAHRIARSQRHEFHEVVDPVWLQRRRGGPLPEQPPADLEIDTDWPRPAA